MKHAFDPTAMRRALAVRGMNLRDLAEAAGLTPATCSSALNGHQVTLVTATRIARAINDHHPVPGMEELIALAPEPS
jgi:lambda repressor-like predicted transcriptional regulator